MQVQIKKINSKAKLPVYAYQNDAGMDLFSVEDIVLQPGELKTISTGIAMAIPVGYVGLLWDKSGLASKYELKVMGGIIDSNYRGEIKIIIKNLSKVKYKVKQGNKIAQMLIQKVENPLIKEVAKLGDTNRNQGGFGSTGLT